MSASWNRPAYGVKRQLLELLAEELQDRGERSCHDHHAPRQMLRAALIELLFGDAPDYCTYECEQRATHADLAGMDAAQLRVELERVRLLLIFHHRPPAWYQERLRTIRARLEPGPRRVA